MTRIQACLGHRNQPSLASFPLILADLIGLAPNRRLGASQDFVLRYDSSILENKITPYQSPSHLFETSRFQTPEGFELDDFALFRRPTRSSAYLLCCGFHSLTPRRELGSIALFGFGSAAHYLRILYRRPGPRATGQNPVHGLLYH